LSQQVKEKYICLDHLHLKPIHHQMEKNVILTNE